MLIISDTSPITNLIQINNLDILETLFKQVIIPEKVFEELLDYERQKEAIESRSWIKVKPVLNRQEVIKLENLLDSGEAEAIILAKELNAEMLIIDERKGRKVAEENGLKIIGLLGILIRGKKKGHIAELKPIINELIQKNGFRVSKNLYERILIEVNEDTKRTK